MVNTTTPEIKCLQDKSLFNLDYYSSVLICYNFSPFISCKFSLFICKFDDPILVPNLGHWDLTDFHLVSQGQFPLVFNQFLPRGFYGETGLNGGVMLHSTLISLHMIFQIFVNTCSHSNLLSI